jgi:outer membrane receptor for ferrienterochelin and colicins
MNKVLSFTSLFSGLLFGICISVNGQDVPVVLDEVEITASRNERLLKNSPEIIRVISQTEIKQLNTNDLSVILDYAAGINIETGTGAGFAKRGVASMNGFPAQYTLVLINGTKILSDHVHTGQNLNFVPVEEIERIEIIKSAASAQYGSDALAGIINIITKTAGTVPTATIYGDLGSYNTYRTGASVQTPINSKTGMYNFIEYEESDGVKLLAPISRVGQMGYNSLNFTSRLTTIIGSKLKLDAWIKTVDNTMQWKDATNDSRLFIPNVLLTYQINENSTINIKTSYTHWFNETNTEDSHLLKPEIWYSAKLGSKNNLLAGGDFSLISFTRSKVDKNTQRMLGFFVQDDHSFNEKIIASAALRMDVVQFNEPVFTPKVSLLFKQTENLRFRTSFSQGFHSPTIHEMYEVGFGHAGTALRFGNPDLKPEHSSTFALGIDYDFKDKLFFNISGFYSNITNMIVPVYMGAWSVDTTKDVWMRQNILKAEIMKKLFCVVVTDPAYVVGLDSPIIFHIKCEDSNTAEETAVNVMVGEDYEYDPQDVDNLDIFSFEVTDLDIIEL